MSNAPITLSFGVSTEQAARAFARFAESIRQLGDVARRTGDNIHRWTLPHKRAHHGGNAADARRWPDQRQSAVCSAWLHASCPSDAHRLDCTCTCHTKGTR